LNKCGREKSNDDDDGGGDMAGKGAGRGDCSRLSHGFNAPRGATNDRLGLPGRLGH
jgi:hypothetical protein